MKKHTWLDALENASLVGLGVGSVASLVFKEILYTTTPLSLLVAMGIINRRRYEQVNNQINDAALADLESRFAHRVNYLQQQVMTMPTPETLHNVRKSLLRKDREVAEALYAEVKAVQQEINERLDSIDQQSVEPVRQNLQQLEGRCTFLSDGLAQLGKRLDEIPDSAKLKGVESHLDQVRGEVERIHNSLETLSAQTKPTINVLQEEVDRLDRKVNKLSPSFDVSSVKQEVGELVRLISDLVPRKDLAAAVAEMRGLHEQQESLRQSLESVQTSLVGLQQASKSTKSTDKSVQDTISSSTIPVSTISTASPELAPVEAEFDGILSGQLEADLVSGTAIDFSQLRVPEHLYPELRELGEGYLETWRSQLTSLQDFTQYLADQQKQLQEQVNKLPKTLDVVALQCQVQELSKRIPSPENTEVAFKSRIQDILQQEMQVINQQLQALPTTPQYEFVFDLNLTQSEKSGDGMGFLTGSRAVLEQALDCTQERLILVWPWSDQCDLDDGLLRKLERFLSQGRRLDLGWCHLAERNDEQLLSKIRRSWLLEPTHDSHLQDTLTQLLRLKRTYPNHFQFKILGTSENFLVSDLTFAVLGIADALKTNTALSDLQLKLKTRDPDVIQRLTESFDTPNLAADDITAYWNRAVTRYELGDKKGAIADFSHILKTHPNDAITYNYRGLVQYDLNDAGAAIADFTRSIQRNPHQGAAYCNRGYIRYEQGDQGKAISDYSLAIQAQPDLAIAYFCRGMAWQKLENYQEAAEDYGEALNLQPDVAVVHYYRGIVLQKLERYHEAMSHLEVATREFVEKGHEANAQKAGKHLAKVRQWIAANPDKSVIMPPTQPADSIASVDQVQHNPFESVTIMSFPNDLYPEGLPTTEVQSSPDAVTDTPERSTLPSESLASPQLENPAPTLAAPAPAAANSTPTRSPQSPSQSETEASANQLSNVIPFSARHATEPITKIQVSTDLWATEVPKIVAYESIEPTRSANSPLNDAVYIGDRPASAPRAVNSELETLITFFQSV